MKNHEQFNFSPSIYHRNLMDSIAPEMAYDGRDIKTWQNKLRRKVKLALGDWPESKVPLNVRSLWRRDHSLGTIEKIVFSSEPSADVPAYICLPKNAHPPYTFFICLQGHNSGMHNGIAMDMETESKPIKVPGNQDFAIGCMKRGIAAFCIEQRSFSFRAETTLEKRSPNGCHDAVMHALMLGKTLMGERVYDVERSLDYLYTRDDVNRDKIGVMGHSGGGTITMFSSAIMPRIKFAMPSCYFCTFSDSIMSIYHCADNYVPGLLKYAEMSDVMGLFAPRPVVIVAGKDDNLFPISAVRKSFNKLKDIYLAAGAEENCHLVIGGQGHQFYPDKAWPVMLKALNRYQ